MDTRQTLKVNGKEYQYFSLKALEEQGFDLVSQLPFSLKVLLENLLRNSEDIIELANWPAKAHSDHEIAYRPARVLMQDFTGVPAVVDLAAMREAMKELAGDPNKINPLSPVDLIIDHSVQVDKYGNELAFQRNVEIEMQRNKERYEFLRWGQQAFDNFRVVPPGTGICHQVNLEYLAKVVWQNEKGQLYPDTCVGTDSHTTMINGLGVLGWGVGGIEAEAAMLGQPVTMRIPEVVGFELTGELQEGITATDLVLTITQMLREQGVVGKFVEFYGDALKHLPLAHRATVANMSPEFGATCGFFPVDQQTLDYLALTGRDPHQIAIVKDYCQAQGLWHDENTPAPVFTDTLRLDISQVKTSVAGPKRPQDKVEIDKLPHAFQQIMEAANVTRHKEGLTHGDVVIAAITSCTNTSNPSVLLAAGLLAKNAVEQGLQVKPWVKTSLAPGSKVVTDYLEKAGLQDALNALGFNLVGYGCTTCIGNSGPLDEDISKQITEKELIVCSVLSGNRNFEGRVHPLTRANWLASPPLVVAYALAGKINIDFAKEPIGQNSAGKDIYLKDVWPHDAEVEALISSVKSEMFSREYSDVFTGDDTWRAMQVPSSNTYQWNDTSTYIQLPPFFKGMSKQVTKKGDIHDANVLAVFGDSITTDHISPAGAIAKDSPAAQYLLSKGVDYKDFNSYGSRRGNHEVMMRGTFANIRIRNRMVPGKEGGYTIFLPNGEIMPIYDAAMRYQDQNTDLVVIAGKEYGTGSSRDWAAKGTALLGVKAVIAESYERIHRSNLIGMGVLPLEFIEPYEFSGKETISISGISDLQPGKTLKVTITKPDGMRNDIPVLCRIDTQNELNYFENGGILHYVLRQQS